MENARSVLLVFIACALLALSGGHGWPGIVGAAAVAFVWGVILVCGLYIAERLGRARR